jgi:hypothetical protein
MPLTAPVAIPAIPGGFIPSPAQRAVNQSLPFTRTPSPAPITPNWSIPGPAGTPKVPPAPPIPGGAAKVGGGVGLAIGAAALGWSIGDAIRRVGVEGGVLDPEQSLYEWEKDDYYKRQNSPIAPKRDAIPPTKTPPFTGGQEVGQQYRVRILWDAYGVSYNWGSGTGSTYLSANNSGEWDLPGPIGPVRKVFRGDSFDLYDNPRPYYRWEFVYGPTKQIQTVTGWTWDHMIGSSVVIVSQAVQRLPLGTPDTGGNPSAEPEPVYTPPRILPLAPPILLPSAPGESPQNPRAPQRQPTQPQRPPVPQAPPAAPPQRNPNAPSNPQPAPPVQRSPSPPPAPQQPPKRNPAPNPGQQPQQQPDPEKPPDPITPPTSICLEPCIIEILRLCRAIARVTGADPAQSPELYQLVRDLAEVAGAYPKQFPASMPLLTGEPQTIANLPELIRWNSLNLDALTGQYPLEITTYTSDGSERKVTLQDQSHALSELFGLLVVIAEDADAVKNITVRGIAETIQAKIAALQAGQIAKANANYLGYQGKSVPKDVKLSVTPSAVGANNKLEQQELADFLKPSTRRYISWEFAGDNIQGVLFRILEGVEIARAALFQPIKSGKGKARLTGDWLRADNKKRAKESDKNWADLKSRLKKQGAEVTETKGVKKNGANPEPKQP